MSFSPRDVVKLPQQAAALLGLDSTPFAVVSSHTGALVSLTLLADQSELPREHESIEIECEGQSAPDVKLRALPTVQLSLAAEQIHLAGFRLSKESFEQLLREETRSLAATHCRSVHLEAKPFEAGDRIPYAGRVYDEKEVTSLVDSALDFWLTAGRFSDQFERDFAKYLGVRNCRLVNSGSSADLIAFYALTSPLLAERQILPGDEVITVAAGFPATITPIIQYGAVPVFLDVDIPSYNIDCDALEEALNERTKAIMLAHTLGNLFNLKKVSDFCKRHNLWLIEDNCDALGARYKLDGKWQLSGTIGDFGTSSFYPPHHMTMGEGGAVYTDSPKLDRIVASFRDWGRDCWCPAGKDNTCGKRFQWKLGELPEGYDHKYIYSHLGFNLKATDMQAAIGIEQLKKLPDFVAARRKNWDFLRAGLAKYEEHFILPEPEPDSEPSWFGFLITLRDERPGLRDTFVRELESAGIQTRMLFSGNFVRQPCFNQLREQKDKYRIVGDLKKTNIILERTFWIGVYPGLSEEQLEYICNQIGKTCEQVMHAND